MPFPAPAAPATSSKSPKLISREAPGNRIQMGNWNGSRAGHGSKEYNAWQFPLFDNADFKNPSCPICEFFLQIIYPNPCQTAATKRTNQNHGGLELKNDQKVKPGEADWI
jgi:hypothetical protein